MRLKFRHFFLAAVVILGFVFVRGAINFNNQAQSINELNYKSGFVSYETEGHRTPITIVKKSTTVKRGGSGFITIKGIIGERYTIKTSYVSRNDIVSAKKTIVANDKGFATFTWSVDNDTVPGTYPVIITSDFESINLTHVVL
jgi:hypothetical protein